MNENITEPIKKKTVMSQGWKHLTSIVICYCTFTLGLSIGFVGASLFELSQKFNTDISGISKVFTIITVSFLIGAIGCGILFNFVNRQFTAAIILIIMGISIGLLPIVPTLEFFFASASVGGASAAGYDTAQIVWIIEMWGDKAAPYIQTQHFSFALGTFLSPLLMKPFLLDTGKMNHELSNFDTKALLINDSIALNSSRFVDESSIEQNESRIYIPYGIGGLSSVIGGIVIILLFFIKKYEDPSKIKTVNEMIELEKNDGKSPPIAPENVIDEPSASTKGADESWTKRRVLLLILSAAFLGTYQGMELCSFQFIVTFTRYIELGLSQPEGALVASGLGGSFCFGRLLGIFIVLKVSPEYLLLTNFFAILIGNSILLLWANDSYVILWTSVLILGFGFSTVYPSFYGYIEKYLKVTNIVGAVMIVAGGLVSSLYPLIIGSQIEENPFVLTYTNFFSLTISSISFVIIYFITKFK